MNKYKCIDCYFYKSCCMSNSCDYFEQENFNMQKECDAYTKDGHISPELEDKIFRETDGNFGKPIGGTE